MEPRRCRRGDRVGSVSEADDRLLQWSRDVAVAVTRRTPMLVARTDALQWSRDVAVAVTVRATVGV